MHSLASGQMLSSGLLDVAIGLILVYLLLSLFCSALTELVATLVI